MGIWYCSREDVKSALDSQETARNNAQIDREIESASRGAEALLHRRFAPTLATRYKDWPNDQMGRSFRIWLDQDELVSMPTAVVAGGQAVSLGNVLLEPANDGPPFNRLEISLASTSSFNTGSTHQRDIAITGPFGHSDEQLPAGTLVGGIDALLTTTALVVSDGSRVGVGALLSIGTERVIVTERTMVTTGQTLQTPVGANNNEVTMAVASGAACHVGEVILLDAERMLIVDIAGNNLIVKRAWDGSVLAAHTGSTVYASRQLTVTRAALGTTAAAHNNADLITSWLVPGPVRQLVIAEVLNTFEQESSGYARTIGSGDNVRNASGAGIGDIRDAVYTSHGRKVRKGAV